MGKSTSWLRRLFGISKAEAAPPDTSSSPKRTKERKWWSNLILRSLKDSAARTTPMPLPPLLKAYQENATAYPESFAEDANKQAIAVAAATAAVAEAAIAAAEAAAAVVRLTSAHGGGRYVSSDQAAAAAAVKIQSTFRAYLARRALRALKGLVKLQALVRGHFVRKQTADMLRRMQALLRVQARVRATRAQLQPSDSSLPNSFIRCASNSNVRDKAQKGSMMADQCTTDHSWSQHRRHGSTDDEICDKILGVDTGNPCPFSSIIRASDRTLRTPHKMYVSGSSPHRARNRTADSPFRQTRGAQNPAPSASSSEAASTWKNVLKTPFKNVDGEAVFYTAESAPQLFSVSSRFGGSAKRGSFTPARSEHSRNFYAGYLDYPNYMSNTESSRAKVRSQSAPRQRLEFDSPARPLHKKSDQEPCDAQTNVTACWDSSSLDHTVSDRFACYDDRMFRPS